MNRKTLIIIAVIGLVVIGVASWSLLSGGAPSGSQATSTPSFPSSGSASQDHPMIQVLNIQNDPNVQAALAEKLPDSHFGFYGTVIVMPYALQNWGDDNTGSQALLKYETSIGWTVLNLGGGAWDLPSLKQQGVPESIAAQLIAGEK